MLKHIFFLLLLLYDILCIFGNSTNTTRTITIVNKTLELEKFRLHWQALKKEAKETENLQSRDSIVLKTLHSVAGKIHQ